MIKLNNLFEEIFNKYYKDIYRLSYSYTLNKNDSEDISQKVFIKLYENINKFNLANEDVKRWLFKVTSNECINHKRSFWIKNIIKNDELLKNENEYNLDETLLNTLKTLDYKYRIPLYLYYYEGYKINEIATILHKTENCIKQRLKRGKEILKLEWREQ